MDIKNILQVTEEVTEWQELAKILGIMTEDILTITGDPRNFENNKRVMFNVWLQKDKNASWTKLAEALAHVGYQNLANITDHMAIMSKFSDNVSILATYYW